MNKFKAECLSYLDQQGLRYHDRDENAFTIKFNGSNMDTVEIVVTFDRDGEGLVSFHSWSIGSVKQDEKFARSIVLCNELNKQYRWVKFYLDDDRDVAVQSDAIVTMESVGPVVAQLVNRIADITDSGYPEFMKLLWG